MNGEPPGLLDGLVDLQVNGAAGHDLTSAPDRLWDVAAALPAFGVTAFLPTVITSDPRVPARALEALAGGPPPGWVGATPLGLHLEGPMLAPARKGAHPEEWLRPPSLELVADWSREAGVAMVTLAPELPHALEVIEALVGRGVVVSVGHTAATAAEVAAAVEAGATCVTHLGNAMPPMGAREPGPVGAALGSADLVAGVIVDGHHLDPPSSAPPGTPSGRTGSCRCRDTTAALGLPDGRRGSVDRDVVVADGAVRLADGTLAGSAASLRDCLRLLVEQTGCSVEEAVATATTTPLRLLGLDPGSGADACSADGGRRPSPRPTPSPCWPPTRSSAWCARPPGAVLGLATGSSPLPAYRELVRRHAPATAPSYAEVRVRSSSTSTSGCRRATRRATAPRSPAS